MEQVLFSDSKMYLVALHTFSMYPMQRGASS